MEELHYGPNGGLIYCMEFLMNNLDWFEDEVGAYTDDYLIIDCPGQIELYTHFDIMKRLVEALGRLNIAICGVYLLESVSIFFGEGVLLKERLFGKSGRRGGVI